MKKKNLLICISYIHIAQLLIFTFSCDLLLSSILFWFNITIAWYTLPISFLISELIVIWVNNDIDGKQMTYEAVICIFIFIICSFISGKFYDVSWDGNSYHKLAIGLLKYHWNPVKKYPPLKWLEGAGAKSQYTLWVEAYCKATWIFASSVYALTGNIETGKSYTLLSMICVFFISTYYFEKKIKKKKIALLLAAISATNPIAVQQWDTFYIDGFLQCILYVLVLSLLMLYDDVIFNKKVSLCLVIASMVLCGNIKFTGLLYGGTFCILFYIISCIKIYINDRNSWLKISIRNAACYLLLAAITIFVAGNSSYLSNMIRHRMPTYPLMGVDKVDIISSNSPFTRENHVTNLLMSLFSKTDNFKHLSGKTVELKIPFTFFGEYELSRLRAPDIRLAGFGVLFSGILLSSIVVLILLFAFILEKNSKYWISFLGVIICIGLAFAIKVSWWARYAPYIYFIVIIALYLLGSIENKRTYIIMILLSFLLLVNNLLPCYWIGKDYTLSKRIAKRLDVLRDQGVVDVYTQDSKGIYFNLRDEGIYFYSNKSLVNREDAIVLRYRDLIWTTHK